MKKTKTRVLLFFIIVLIFVAGFLFFFCSIPDSFTTTTYTLKTSKITNKIRIAHLSDVHNQEYGEGNEELLQAVASQKPDLIFITGDSVSKDDEDVVPAVSLVEKLTQIAPVYFSYGNHELLNEETYNRNLGDIIADAGAQVLDFSYEDVDINGQKLRIGGLYGYCLPEKYLETGEARPEECAFLNEFQNTERYTMLLTHMPLAWLELEALEEWDVDCVFSGHSHGGQMVLPLLGPLYAPDQGWFPEKISGIFSSENGTKNVIVSRGLGDSVKIPRINNEPELIVVDILPE